MFYFPQQRRLIIKSLKANESRTKTLLTSVSSGYYQANRYNSPAWTPTLSYDSSLFVSVPSDSTLCDESGCFTWEKMEFENIRRSAMPVLQETGEFNRQTEEILTAIIFIENQLRESLTGEISVLCSGYIVTRCFAAVFSNSLRELEALETGLPISLLPKVEEIRDIASSIGEKVEELNDTIKEIQTKLKEFKRQKLEITEEDKKELDMLVIEFEGHIDEAEVFLKGGEEAMKSFEAGVSSCNWQDGVQRAGSVVAATAAGAVAGALFGGAVNAAAKGAGMVGKAGKFMLDMGVTTKTAAVGGAVLTGTQSFKEQLTLFLPLFFGASVAGLCLFFALNYWFPKNELYNKLALVIRNYSNMVHRSRDIKLQIK